jgi:positive regulator of sigma E activity
MKKKKKEFSKVLLIQESILIWILTLSFIVLAFICIMKGFLGTLPWLSAMSAFPWSAYGVSQAFYYNKSKAENTQGGIVYDKHTIIDNGI